MTPQEDRPLTLREELQSLAGQDATLAHMLKMNRPLNQETYLAMQYPDCVPARLSAEQLSAIPAPLRSKLPQAPDRSNFQTQEEFEEAMGYWHSHVGRIKGMADRAKKKAV